MIQALTLILSCQLAGEILTRLLGWPVPGPVFGMALLFALMLASPHIATAVIPTAEGILRHLSLLFVPAGVGVVGHLPLLATYGFGVALALVVSTVLAIGAGAVAFVLAARAFGGASPKDMPDA